MEVQQYLSDLTRRYQFAEFLMMLCNTRYSIKFQKSSEGNAHCLIITKGKKGKLRQQFSLNVMYIQPWLQEECVCTSILMSCVCKCISERCIMLLALISTKHSDEDISIHYEHIMSQNQYISTYHYIITYYYEHTILQDQSDAPISTTIMKPS